MVIQYWIYPYLHIQHLSRSDYDTYHARWKPIDPDTKAMLDRLLLERVPLAGITRVLQVGEAWLHRYVNRLLSALPRQA